MISDFAKKFSKPEDFQRLKDNKPFKSSNTESVKIPLFNPSAPFKEKIKALVDAIVAWWNSKADTKAFLRALGDAITNNLSEIENLRKGAEPLTFTFAVSKTNDRFDRLFVTLTLQKEEEGYILKHQGRNFGYALTLNELKEFKIKNYSDYDIKALGDVVRELKASDIRRKSALVSKKGGFSDKTEYDIASYAKHKTTDPDLQKALTKGMATIAKLGYSFSNAKEVVDTGGQVKHSAGKIKFDSSNVVFDGDTITLTNDLQLIKLCKALMAKPLTERTLLFRNFIPIMSQETRDALQKKHVELLLNINKVVDS